MSFMLRSTSRTVFNTTQIFRRYAHKKATIQVKLTQFVETVGIEGDIVSVRPGLMRNVLYPAGKAEYLTRFDSKEPTTDDSSDILASEKKKERELFNSIRESEIRSKLESVRELQFNRAVVPNSDHIFGSVTAEDIVGKIKEQFGLDLEKSEIEFKSEGGRIKALGQHKISVKVDSTEGYEINVIVNPEA